MFEKNYEILAQLVADKGVIWPHDQQIGPDGKPDLAANMRIWNNAVARFEEIPLWAEGAPGFDDRDPMQVQPNIIFVPTPNREKTRGTIIVAHGGAFFCHAGHEGFHAAKYFTDAGFNTAILTYRLLPYTRRDAIADMQRAIRTIRARKDELGVTDKVVVMGFSAGGMLSGNCATHYDAGNPLAADPIERESCRPDAAVLCYAAFATVAFPEGMMRAPFGEPDRAEKLYLAPEKNVTADTPPFYIWQTISDDPRNAFVLSSALTEAGVPFELHCFPVGVHGVGLADGGNDNGYANKHLNRWADLCVEWLNECTEI